MARRTTNGLFSDEQLKMLATQPDQETLHAQMRDMVREVFDDAIERMSNFEDALVAVYSAGMKRAMEAKPKRTRKAKAQADAQP